MPVNILNSSENKAKYYNFKSGLAPKTINGVTQEIKQPAVFKYNPETKKQVFVSDNIGGYLYETKIGKPKETSFGTITEFFLEFHSVDDGKLSREVLVINIDSKVFKMLIAKLSAVTNFGNVVIRGTQYKGRDEKWRDTVMVYSNGEAMPKIINYKYKEGSDFSQPDNLVELPPIEYDTDEKGHIFQDKDGKDIISNRWKAKVDKIYLDQAKKIIERNKEWVEKNPFEIKYEPPKNDYEPPEIDIDDIKVEMPF